MRVVAKQKPGGVISYRPLMIHPSQSVETQAKTVLLTNVRVSGSIKGDVVESNDEWVKPRKEVATWPQMRYFRGDYIDTLTTEKVDRARAVYICGKNVYYLP